MGSSILLLELLRCHKMLMHAGLAAIVMLGTDHGFWQASNYALIVVPHGGSIGM